ncbi:MAG: glycosyltransferase [Candidatus Shapirobacteria bacterium]|jgi:glycosyltransferase involved in cell wall biosynthesis
MTVSIIIPTYNRSITLRKCLDSIKAQSYDQDKIEIIVVDDGSTDNTSKVVKNNIGSLNIAYYYQSNRGPSAARNLAIRKSKNKIILIINDDTILSKEMVEEHVRFHNKFKSENCAILGYVEWDNSINLTPYMKWLQEKGPLFAYYEIKGIKANWGFAFTCNISYKRKFLLKNGLFDEDFPYAAWEDIELAYRLSQKGMILYYNKKAIGYHHHFTTLQSSLRKMITQGKSAIIMSQKIKQQADLPPISRKIMGKNLQRLDSIFLNKPIAWILEKIAFFLENKFIISPLFTILLLHYRLIGRKEMLKIYAQKDN